MSKKIYHFCHKYEEWVDKLKKVKYTDEKINCDLNCKECEHNDNIWVEED